jgi:hypothetical protein
VLGFSAPSDAALFQLVQDCIEPYRHKSVTLRAPRFLANSTPNPWEAGSAHSVGCRTVWANAVAPVSASSIQPNALEAESSVRVSHIRTPVASELAGPSLPFDGGGGFKWGHVGPWWQVAALCIIPRGRRCNGRAVVGDRRLLALPIVIPMAQTRGPSSQGTTLSPIPRLPTNFKTFPSSTFLGALSFFNPKKRNARSYRYLLFGSYLGGCHRSTLSKRSASTSRIQHMGRIRRICQRIGCPRRCHLDEGQPVAVRVRHGHHRRRVVRGFGH